MAKIHQLLLVTETTPIAQSERLRSHYGPTTARAVRNYKERRGIINRSYQVAADDIVGVMTIARMDQEMLILEHGRPRGGYWALRFAIPATGLAEAADAASVYRDLATAMQSPLRAFRALGGSGSSTIAPLPGHRRHAICEIAKGVPEKGRFQPIYWDVVVGSFRTVAPTADQLQSGEQWCGIYATWIWRQAALLVNWRMGAGIFPEGKSNRVPTSTDKTMIAPGDIIVDGTKTQIKKADGTIGYMQALHHMLVLEVSLDHTRATVLEGNYGTGLQNQTQTVVNRGRIVNLAPISFFYSVDSYRWPEVRYEP